MGQHIRITLTPEERAEIEARIRATPERKIADRFRAVLYKADGRSHQEIADLLQIQSVNTITTWLHVYVERGLEALSSWEYKGSEPRLEPSQQQALKVELTTNIYHTTYQAIAWVQAQFAVEYTPRGMSDLLKRLGFTYKKSKLLPSKANPEVQAQFVADYRRLVREPQPGDRIYFGDAAHFIHNAEAGYSWSLRGKPHYIPANSGRSRYNVLGVYCVQTQEFLFIPTTDNINRSKVMELLTALRDRHPAPARLYLILDNARYNHAQEVTTHCQQTGITRIFLPSYSPNLNVIERLWQCLREEVLQDHYYATFAQFVAAIRNFLESLGRRLPELATRLTDHFEELPSGWQVAA